MTAEQIISDLGALLGMPTLALSGKGNCDLVFDGHLGVTVAYQPDEQRLILASVIDSTGAAMEPSTLEAMLRGNHLWLATCGETLSISEDRKAWLMRPVAIDGLSGRELLNVVEQHVNTLEQWVRRLQTRQPASEAHERWQPMQRV